jgi:hypothetical protein
MNRKQLTAFFAWSAWATTAKIPGKDYSYTNNFPYDPLAGNRPTGAALLWTGISFIALLGGIAAVLLAFGKFDYLGWHGAPTPVDRWVLSPAQKATLKYMAVASILLLGQTFFGAGVAHYRADPGTFYGVDLAAYRRTLIERFGNPAIRDTLARLCAETSDRIPKFLLPTIRALGIGFVPYSPLGRGFLTGRFRRFEDLAPDDYRRQSPRFQGENFEKNLRLVERIRELAAEKKVKPSQLALAWVLAQGKDVVPIPGTTTRVHLEENVAAVGIALSKDDLARIDRVAPKGVAAGERYPPATMATVNR